MSFQSSSSAVTCRLTNTRGPEQKRSSAAFPGLDRLDATAAEATLAEAGVEADGVVAVVDDLHRAPALTAYRCSRPSS
jgi:hypothetical protein